MEFSPDQLRDLDKQHLWHPFTQMQDWCADDHEPLIIDRGEGAWLFDTEGNRYVLSEMVTKGPVIVAFFPKAFTPG